MPVATVTIACGTCERTYTAHGYETYSSGRAAAEAAGWWVDSTGCQHCPQCPDLLNFHIPSQEALNTEIAALYALARADVHTRVVADFAEKAPEEASQAADPGAKHNPEEHIE